MLAPSVLKEGQVPLLMTVVYFFSSQFIAACRFGGVSVFCTNSVLLTLISTVPASRAYESIPRSHAHSPKMQFLVAVFQTVLEPWLGATHLSQLYLLRGMVRLSGIHESLHSNTHLSVISKYK